MKTRCKDMMNEIGKLEEENSRNRKKIIKLSKIYADKSISYKNCTPEQMMLIDE